MITPATVGSKPMLGRAYVFSESELPRTTEDRRNFNGAGLAPIDHPESPDDHFADIWSVSLGYDAP